MKRLVKRLMQISALVLVGCLFSLWFDPYNVFHVENARPYQVLSQNSRFLKTANILRGKIDCDTYLFGSSLVGAIDVAKLDEARYGRAYNMTSSGMTPMEHLQDMEFLLRHGWRPETVMIGVDSIAVRSMGQDGTLSRAPYPPNGNLPLFYLKYLNPVIGAQGAFAGGWEEMKIALSGRVSKRLYTTGAGKLAPVRSATEYLGLAPEAHERALAKKSVRPYRITKAQYRQSLAILEDTKRLLDAYGVEMVLFVNPQYSGAFHMAGKRFMDYLEQLSQIIDYYNFYGLNAYTRDADLYMDVNHYVGALGDEMIEVFNGHAPEEALIADGFGVYVTEDSAPPLCDRLRDQWEQLAAGA